MSTLFTSVRRLLLRVSSRSATSVRSAGAANLVRAWRILLAFLWVSAMATGCTVASGNQQERAQPAVSAQQVPPTPTLPPSPSPEGDALRVITEDLAWPLEVLYGPDGFLRSEERRVGKECRCRLS